jgi:hypothetical protein
MTMSDARRVLTVRKAVDAFCGDHRVTAVLRRWRRAFAALRQRRS